jgi:hypothetical protein
MKVRDLEITMNEKDDRVQALVKDLKNSEDAAAREQRHRQNAQDQVPTLPSSSSVMLPSACVNSELPDSGSFVRSPATSTQPSGSTESSLLRWQRRRCRYLTGV